MAYSAHPFTKYELSKLQKLVKLDPATTYDTVKAVAVSAGVISGVRDSAQFMSDVLAVSGYAESAGGTYPAGGVTLTTVALTLDAANHRYKLTCDPIVFSTSTGINAAYIVFVDTTPGSNATNPVIGYWDLGGTQTILSITPDPTGLLLETGV